MDAKEFTRQGPGDFPGNSGSILEYVGDGSGRGSGSGKDSCDGWGSGSEPYRGFMDGCGYGYGAYDCSGSVPW